MCAFIQSARSAAPVQETRRAIFPSSLSLSLHNSSSSRRRHVGALALCLLGSAAITSGEHSRSPGPGPRRGRRKGWRRRKRLTHSSTVLLCARGAGVQHVHVGLHVCDGRLRWTWRRQARCCDAQGYCCEMWFSMVQLQVL